MQCVGCGSEAVTERPERTACQCRLHPPQKWRPKNPQVSGPEAVLALRGSAA
jgi:hypothetical protein